MSHNNRKYEGSVNLHHMFWIRNNYRTPTLKRLRSLGGLVIPAMTYDHQLLHAQMRPMVVPMKPLAEDIIDFASSVEQVDRFDVANETIGFLHEQAEIHTSDEYAFRAKRLAYHLGKQVGYLSLHDLPERIR